MAVVVAVVGHPGAPLAAYFLVDEVDDEGVLAVPLAPLPDAGLPDVPVSPVFDVPAVVPEAPVPLAEADGVLVPVAEPGIAVLEAEPGVVVPEVSVLVAAEEGVVDVVAGGVVLEGVVVLVVVVDVVPVCLSQPVRAAPARARTATTGMIFFMDFSNRTGCVGGFGPRGRPRTSGTHTQDACRASRAV